MQSCLCCFLTKINRSVPVTAERRLPLTCPSCPFLTGFWHSRENASESPSCERDPGKKTGQAAGHRGGDRRPGPSPAAVSWPWALSGASWSRSPGPHPAPGQAVCCPPPAARGQRAAPTTRGAPAPLASRPPRRPLPDRRQSLGSAGRAHSQAREGTAARLLGERAACAVQGRHGSGRRRGTGL